MSPSNQEIQLRKNCQLYAYVLESLGKEVPEAIEDCRNWYEYSVDCIEELFQILDNLDKDTLDALVNNKDSEESQNLLHWWNMHQEANRLHKALSSDI